MKTFREIKVWRKAMNSVTKLYAISKNFPNEELFGLTSQMRRSAISIPSNIAEGFRRRYGKDFKDSCKLQWDLYLNFKRNLKLQKI